MTVERYDDYSLVDGHTLIDPILPPEGPKGKSSITGPGA